MDLSYFKGRGAQVKPNNPYSKDEERESFAEKVSKAKAKLEEKEEELEVAIETLRNKNYCKMK